MKALAKQVINKLKTFELRVIGINGPYIQELTFDDNSPELYESEIFLYRKIISFTVSFKEE
jgi:Ribonuclease G/E